MDKVINQLYDRYYAKQKQGDTLQAKWQGKANEVCDWFNIRRPTIRINPRQRNGRYKSFSEIVVIGEKCWRGIENSFVHEIAHHITRVRFGSEAKSHGRQYKRILWSVAQRYFPTPQAYSWDNEYKAVKRFAEKKLAKL